MKRFNGKAIYNPSGKAGEYSYWAYLYDENRNGKDYLIAINLNKNNVVEIIKQ